MLKLKVCNNEKKNKKNANVQIMYFFVIGVCLMVLLRLCTCPG